MARWLDVWVSGSREAGVSGAQSLTGVMVMVMTAVSCCDGAGGVVASVGRVVIMVAAASKARTMITRMARFISLPYVSNDDVGCLGLGWLCGEMLMDEILGLLAIQVGRAGASYEGLPIGKGKRMG